MRMGAGTQPPPPMHSSQAPPSTPRIKRNLVRRLVEQFNEEARLRDRDGQPEHSTPPYRTPYVIESNSRNVHNHLQPFNYTKNSTVDQHIWRHPEVEFTRTPPTKPVRRKTKAVPTRDAPINGRVIYHRFDRADENHINEDDRSHRVTPTYFFGQHILNNDSLHHRSSLASNSSGDSVGEGGSSMLSAKLVRRADKRVSAHTWARNYSPEAVRRSTTPTIIPIRVEHHKNGKTNGAGHNTPTANTNAPIRVNIVPPSPTGSPTSDGIGDEGRDVIDGELSDRVGGLSVDRRKSRSRSFGGADVEPRRVYFSAHPPRVPSTGNGEVITHAAAVADIPPPPNQRVSRTVQRSFSMLSPWAPRIKPKSRASPSSHNSSSAAYSSSSSRSHSPAPVNVTTLNGNGAPENDSKPNSNLNPKPKEKVKVRRRHSMPKGFLFRRKKRPQ